MGSLNLGKVLPTINGKVPVNGELTFKPSDIGAVDKTGDTMTGKLVAQSNSEYTVAQMRNVILSTSAPTDADGNDGDIWLQYV